MFKIQYTWLQTKQDKIKQNKTKREKNTVPPKQVSPPEELGYPLPCMN